MRGGGRWLIDGGLVEDVFWGVEIPAEVAKVVEEAEQIGGL
jgi:hypothetical protein